MTDVWVQLSREAAPRRNQARKYARAALSALGYEAPDEEERNG